jgi:hypothetical protein
VRLLEAVKSWMPWVLVVALVGAVAYALGSVNRPAEPISATPTPPIAPAPDLGAPGHGEGEPMGQDTPGVGTGVQETLTGVVREHKDVAQYTYLRLDTDSGETWAAVYRAPVKDGATVTVIHASSIHGFHSRELGRDFDTIWFGMLPGYETAPSSPGSSQSASAAAIDALPDASKLRRARVPNGAITIADLASKAAALDGTQVTLVGKVVKENDGIMGRNWIHIQDGSGNAASKTNDLLVTTDSTAQVGDEIQISGTVRTKQDYGAGYAYEFLVEHATVGAPSQ